MGVAVPIVLGVTVAILCQAGVLFIQLKSKVPTFTNLRDVDPPAVECSVDGLDEATARFTTFLRFPTVSNWRQENHMDKEREPIFRDAVAFLEKSYPLVWKHMEVEKVGTDGHTLLLKWAGTDLSKLPILFISHYDVVPAVDTDGKWLHGPFSGDIADGYIWGRGTLDVKIGVVGLLEAAAALIKDGFTPTRTVYYAFGHDEEAGGSEGAAKASALLKSRGIEFDVIVDEGGVILRDGVRPLSPDHPTALVATCEKIATVVEVAFTAPGGHASMPVTDGSDVSSQISRFVAGLGTRPPPAELRAPMAHFLKGLVPYVSSVKRVLMWHADSWPWSQLLAFVFTKSGPDTAAMVRMTVAVTRIQAGVSQNVLPQHGTVTLNVRSHPEISKEEITGYLEEVLLSSKTTGSIVSATQPPRPAPGVPFVADHEAGHFQAVKRALQEVWRYDGQAVGVVPYLMTGSTDSRHYISLSRGGVLRVGTFSLNKTSGDSSLLHGFNERILEGDFKKTICTYRRLLELMT